MTIPLALSSSGIVAMKKDYSVEIMIWALGGTAVALAMAALLSIMFSLW
jgi:hypothetical protein